MSQRKSKNGKWEIQGYVSINGMKKRYHRSGFNSRTEAMEAETDIRRKLRAESFKDSNSSFFDIAEECMKLTKTRIKESTYITYTQTLEKAYNDFGKKPIGNLTVSYMQRYIDKLDSMYSKKYVSMQFYILNKIFEYAVVQGYISENPLRRVLLNARKNELRKEMKIFEPEDFEKFIGVANNEEYRCFFMFLYYMGTRKGEARAITWNDINFAAKTVRIEKTLSDTTGKISSPKTQNSYRTITIPAVLLKALKEHREIQEKYSEFNEGVFVFGFDRPLPAENIRRNLKKWIKLSGVHDIRVHDLRHSHASFLINNMSAGFTDFDIAKRLGDTVQTLHSTYAHWFKSGDSGIVDFMNISL